ncbi:unnamed protein product [Trichobilharzia szidati]|nr:unnamed protein product [Trichobilharzia szidati]
MDEKTELELINSGIRNIDGLNKVPNLRYLDLSSNFISKICGINNLRHLRTLNLSSNSIKTIEALGNLHCLVRLDVSFNEITNLDGLKDLFGPNYNLTVIILQGNRIESRQHLLECTKGLINLRQLVLFNPQTGDDNPVCRVQDYRISILQGLPQLEILDHVDRMGRATHIDVLADLPELNDFMDLVSTGTFSESDNLLMNEAKKHEYHHDQIDLPIRSNELLTKIVNNEVRKIHPTTFTTHEKDPVPNSLTSTTEHRLLNLESQLNSLITLQLLRIHQTESDQSRLSCNTHQATLENCSSKDNSANVTCQQNESNPCNVNNSLAETHKESLQHIPEKEVSNKKHPTEPKTQSDNVTSQLTNENQSSHHHHHHSCVESHKTSTNNIPRSTKPTQNVDNALSKTRRVTVNENPPGAPIKLTSQSSRKMAHQNTSDKKTKQDTLRKLNSTRSNSQDVQCKSVQVGEQYIPGHLTTSYALMKVQSSSDHDKSDKSFGKILKELDREKMQRKQAEQLCQQMVNRIRELETSAIDETEALKVTEDLKQAFTAEHHEKLAIQLQLNEMEKKFNEVCQAAENLRIKEDTAKSLYQQEIDNLNKLLAEARKDYKDVLSRAEKAEQKLDKTQCLLRNRELEYNQELNNRYKLDSPELTKLISDKIDLVQTRNLQTIEALQEKLTESGQRYTALEDEFRMALRIEAERYETLLKTSELCKEELSGTQSQLKERIEREESTRHLIEELNTVIKEQKSKYTSQQKANLLLQHNLKERIATLEAHLEEARTRITNHENLRKEIKQQKAEMAAQESIIAGLRAERRNWSEELAKQGSALAQDRGRLEAKIEAQELEIASLKKSLESENDSVKIKNKIIDDQTDTILNLKKCIQENQAEIKRLQNDAVQNHRSLENQLSQKVKENTEMNDEIKHLVKRKEDLKQLVSGLQSKVDELQEQNDSMSQRWRDRSSLIDKLEKQVEQMRHNWDEERKRLINERDTAQKQVSTLHSKMESMDEGFRQQLLAVEEMKEIAVNNARKEADQLRIACESRVAEVESEMRAVLLEAETTKQAMEERLRSISIALCNPVLPDYNALKPQHMRKGEYVKSNFNMLNEPALWHNNNPPVEIPVKQYSQGYNLINSNS